jgi:CBS domain containing-hemolysin-like protein
VAQGHRPIAVISFRDLVEARATEDPHAPFDVDGRQLHLVPEGIGLRRVAALMVRKKIGLVPVVDSFGHLRKVISRRDIMLALMGTLDEHDSFGAEA